MSVKTNKRRGFTPSVIGAPAFAGVNLSPPKRVAAVLNRNKKGFTLIELLVVVAIIALLLSILTPALNSVKERAKRILCSNRLKQWGIAIHAYNTANDDKMMKIVRRWPSPDPVNFPCYVSTIQSYPAQLSPAQVAEGIDKNEWNAYRINPYLEVMDKNYEDTGIVNALVTCPNCSGDFMQNFIMYDNWYHPTDPPNFDFIEIAYCYWAGIDQVEEVQRSSQAIRFLTMDIPSPKRLLMSEILWLTGPRCPNMGYRYNHGKNGWSWNGPEAGALGHNDNSPNPRATGRGQLFGDGRVAWKPIPLDENLPYCPDLFWQVNDGMWNGRDSGWVGDPFDCSYF